MLLSEIEAEAEKLLPSAPEEINKLPEAVKYGVPEPGTLEQWLASHKLSSPRLDQMVDEYKRLWAAGSMKDPSIIRSNLEMREKDK